MKHTVRGKLDLFEFHDCELYPESFERGELIFLAKHLNVHKNTVENPGNFDMEIDSAKITFTNVEVLSCEPMRAYKTDDNGNSYTDEPQTVYRGKEAETYFRDNINKGISINCIDISQKDGKTEIEISTCGQAYFFVTFAFDKVTVEWDGYSKKAWYELYR